MAREERKKEDLFIKEKRRSKNFFITSSVKMNEKDGVNKTTISSSVFTKMSQSFAEGEYLIDDAIREPNASILYMLQEMQQDIDDIYNEVSASSFQASFFPFTRIDTGSFGVVTSSLIPDKDSKYNLGLSGKEWNDLFIDGTANIDSLAMGVTVNAIKDEDNMSSNSNTSLATQQSIKAYVDANAGGGGGSGNYDTGSHLVPHADNTYDLGSSTKEWKNLYVDGIAYLDTIANATMNGATMDSNLIFKRAVIQPSAIQVTSIPQNGLIDMRQYSVVEIKQKIGNWSITTARPAAAFQEITIIGLTAGVIRHNSKGTAFTFSFANGSNLAVSAGQVYKFIVDGNNIWRQIH